jgi:hypothetical protein
LFRKAGSEGRRPVVFVQEPFAVPEVRTTSAEEALRVVLDGAGAVLPIRDAVDRRIVADVRNGAGSTIDSQRQVGGWPEYRGAQPPKDTDGDGMPDDWEIARGLNPRDPSDAARSRGGYTNIEEYINSLARPPK